MVGSGSAGKRRSALSEQAARRFFELLGEKDIDAWGELWHPEARITIPYPAEGFPTSIDGKAEIVAGFRTLFANFESFEAELSGWSAASSTRTTTSPCFGFATD